MIKHIVMWKVEGPSKVEIISEITRKLEALPAMIDEIVDFEVGGNFNPIPVAYDLCLYSTFESKEGLQAYQVHPEHVAVKNYIVSVVAATTVVDYEV